MLSWLLGASGVLWVAVELRQAFHTRPEARSADRGSRPIIGVVGLAGGLIALYVSRTFPELAVPDRTVAAWCALPLLWAGTALRLWSFRTLGHYFTFTVQTSPDQRVVTTGPYRFVRHPAYSALLLAMVAVGLLIGNWLSLLVLVGAVTAALVYRIRVEERALERAIGPAYREYAATRKRLVPFVW